MERERTCGWFGAKPHFPLDMLLMEGVLHCSNIIRSPSLDGTREVHYIYLNKTSRSASSGTWEAWFPAVVSHVGSLVSDRVAELISQPGRGMESGRAMGGNAHWVYPPL